MQRNIQRSIQSALTICLALLIVSTPLHAQDASERDFILLPVTAGSMQSNRSTPNGRDTVVAIIKLATILKKQGLLQDFSMRPELGALQIYDPTDEGLALLRRAGAVNVYRSSEIAAAQAQFVDQHKASARFAVPPAPGSAHSAQASLASAPTATRASLFIDENLVNIYGDAPNTAVTVRLLDSANTLKAQNTVTTDGNGSAAIQFNEIMRSGDVVTLQVAGQNPIQTTIPQISIEADKQRDIVRGIAPNDHYTTFFVQAWRTNEWRNYQSELVVDGSGRYELAIGNQWDLRMSDLGSIISSGEHFDFYHNFTVPGYWVNLSQNYVGGTGLPTGATIKASIYDSSGTLVSEGSGQVDSYGGLFILQFTGCQVDSNDLRAGQRIVFEQQGVPDVTINSPSLTFNLVPDTDTITGRVPSQAKLAGRVWDAAGAVVPTDIDTIFADAAGNFAASFSGRFDLQAGDWGELTYFDSQENQILLTVRAPGLLSADLTSDAANLSANPNQSATLIVRNALGAIKGSTMIKSDETGYGYARITDQAGNLIDLVAGDSLQISGAGLSGTYALTPLTAHADRTTGTVTGQAPPGATLEIDVGYGTNDTQTITANANGEYRATFAEMRGGERIRVAQQTALGRETVVQIYAPQITVDPWSPTDLFIYGYALPQQAVAVDVVDGTSNSVKGHGVAQADQRGFFVIDLEVGTAPTDRVVLRSGTLQLQTVVQPLSFTVSDTTDLLSGQAPAQATLSANMRRSLDGFSWSYFKELTADSNGNFSTDFGGVDFWPGDEFTLYYRNAQGDQQRQSIALPNLEVDQSQDRVYARGEPGTPVKLTLSDAQGALIATTTFTPTSPYRYITSFASDEAGTRQDLVAGQTIRWENNGRQLLTTLPTLQATLDTNLDRVTGIAPANQTAYVAAYHWQEQFFSTWNGTSDISAEAITDSGGKFTADLHCKADLQPGDYGVVQMIDKDKHYHRALGYTTTPSIKLRQVPSTVRAGDAVRVEWEILDGAHVASTSLSWGHPTVDGIFGSTASLQGSAGTYQALFAAPNLGPLVVSAYANVDGQRLQAWSTIEITSTLTLALQDPVNGTTNQAQPTIRGMSVPSATLALYDGSTLVITDVANASGAFQLQPPAALTDGQHELWVKATVNSTTTLESDHLQVTVDATLMVDPMHIFITNREQRQRIHDDQGFANLGGRIWTRSGDIVAIEIPIRCTDVRQADLLVGGVYAATMVDAGNGRWTGTYTPPSSGNYAVALDLNCGGSAERITLLNGLIDPDGYVYWANADTSLRIPGATVSCYQLQDGEWQLWPGYLYDQQNPQITANDGYYAFFTEPGDYQIRVEAPGFEPYTSPTLTVVDEPVHHNAPLEAKEKLYLPVVQR